MTEPCPELLAAADEIASADALVIGTGAGMGVDSGLGTFRGRNAGVWLPLKAMQLDFSEMSCPDAFEEDPYTAWAFWKFRHDAYTQSSPHDGYRLLADLGRRMPKGAFSITSNIDGHWARTAGFGEERTYEMHGALTHMQRVDGTGGPGGIWPTDPAEIERLPVAPWDLSPGEAVEVLQGGKWRSAPSIKVGEDGATIVSYDADGIGGPLSNVRGVRRGPSGPDLCRVAAGAQLPVDSSGRAARPNVLMFGDGTFVDERIDEQERRYERWLSTLERGTKLAVVEVGAGTAVRTIRSACEGLVSKHKGPATLVRLNLDQPLVPASPSGGEKRYIGVGGMGALEAICELDRLVRERMPEPARSPRYGE